MGSAQITLPGFDFKRKLAFGGNLRSHAKSARPVSTKHPMHLVLRSSLARGERSFLARGRRVEQILRRQAERFNLRLYDVANAGNHLHVVVRARSPRGLKNFLRAVTGILARVSLGAERGRPKLTKFWDVRPFSRIVTWGADYTRMKEYLMLNRVETLGMDRLSAREMLAKIRAIERNLTVNPVLGLR